MVGEVACYGGGLVGGDGKDVAEAAAGVDNCFAGFFGVRGCDGRVGFDLRGAYGGDVWACGLFYVSIVCSEIRLDNRALLQEPIALMASLQSSVFSLCPVKR
jgi:hypothetical protein